MDDSAKPLLYGYCGVEYEFLIFRLLQKFMYTLLSNCGPLSVIIYCRIPNRQPIFFHTNWTSSLSLIAAEASVSTHLLKLSIATSNCFFCVGAEGNGLTISIPR